MTRGLYLTLAALLGSLAVIYATWWMILSWWGLLVATGMVGIATMTAFRPSWQEKWDRWMPAIPRLTPEQIERGRRAVRG